MKKDIAKAVDYGIINKMYEEGFLYAAFGEYMRRSHNYNMFKVPFNANFSCPNWDGRLSDTGCVYCPNFARQFTYESFRKVINKGLKEQLYHQMDHYKKVGAGEKGLVYIAFGTNTYAPIDELKKIYDAALDHPDVVGLSIGTRPDCLPDEVLDLLGDYVKKGYEVWLELGQQTMHFHTVEAIKRRHGSAEMIRAVKEAKKRGILTLAFMILGLPGETPSEMRESARILSALEVDAVKIYPLLVMKETGLTAQYKSGAYRAISETEYVSLVADFIENLGPNVLVQRVSKDCGLDGKDAPLWDTHRWVVAPKVEKALMIRGTKQGSKYKLTLSADELLPLDRK
ncbi:MAG: TIGR01212 family radical SAM protein [Candidatus Altiarchaeales archaeon IMC4]|nr:MAG: TIGR01212 family radical SAM protein [Candidatus Altiarchaeales archaeon IMC4]